VMLLGTVDRLVPVEQAEPLRRAIITYLRASSDTASDPALARQESDDAQRQGEALAEPARTLMRFVIARDVAKLGPLLRPFIEELGGAPALSPDRSPVTTAPVFLIHGVDDSVIPSEETPLAADDLRARGNHHVQWLLTPLLTHADLRARASARDLWTFVSFWTAMTAAAR
jgi:pimeloyl-ACP methyl ester carboxylesterase